jgi:hypothetical protein
MGSFMTKIIAGFLAGALAVLIFHQGMYLIMQNFLGIPLQGAPWRTNPAALWPELFGALKMSAPSVPQILHQMIWGGLFGILFAFMLNSLPGGVSLIKGLVFGMVFPMLLGSWLIVAWVKSRPLMAGAFDKGGFNIMALRNGFLLNGVAFGLGLGILYPMLRRIMSR